MTAWVWCYGEQPGTLLDQGQYTVEVEKGARGPDASIRLTLPGESENEAFTFTARQVVTLGQDMLTTALHEAHLFTPSEDEE